MSEIETLLRHRLHRVGDAFEPTSTLPRRIDELVGRTVDLESRPPAAVGRVVQRRRVLAVAMGGVAVAAILLAVVYGPRSAGPGSTSRPIPPATGPMSTTSAPPCSAAPTPITSPAQAIQRAECGGGVSGITQAQAIETTWAQYFGAASPGSSCPGCAEEPGQLVWVVVLSGDVTQSWGLEATSAPDTWLVVVYNSSTGQPIVVSQGPGGPAPSWFPGLKGQSVQSYN
jgi:hypothetical protein